MPPGGRCKTGRRAVHSEQGLDVVLVLLYRGCLSAAPQDLRYIFIPSDIRDYVMLRSAILGVPVPEGHDKGDR